MKNGYGVLHPFPSLGISFLSTGARVCGGGQQSVVGPSPSFSNLKIPHCFLDFVGAGEKPAVSPDRSSDF